MEQKTPFDKNTVIAIAVCLVVLLGWQMYLEKKYPQTPSTSIQTVPQKENQSQKVTSTQNEKTGETVPSKSEKPSVSTGPETVKTYEDANWEVSVSSRGGRISRVLLKKYTDNQGKPIE